MKTDLIIIGSGPVDITQHAMLQKWPQYNNF